MKRYICDSCDREFENYRQLNGHKIVHSTKEPKKRKPYKNRIERVISYCQYCDKEIEHLKGRTKKYCSLQCQADWQWHNINKLRVIEGNGSGKTIKRYLFEEHGEKCSECNIGNNWNGKSLTLQLDHIDGNSDNNCLSNLRILCPNCHSQTSTYGSKGKGKRYTKHTKRNTYLRKYKSS